MSNLKANTIVEFANVFEEAQKTLTTESKRSLDFGGMEPLMWRDNNKKLEDLIIELSYSGFHNIGMTTNGSLLKDFAERISRKTDKDIEHIRNSLKKIRISIHGYTENTYEMIMRPPKSSNGKKLYTPTTIIDGIKQLKKILTDTDFSLNTMVLKNLNDNKENMEALFKTVPEKLINGIKFFTLLPNKAGTCHVLYPLWEKHDLYMKYVMPKTQYLEKLQSHELGVEVIDLMIKYRGIKSPRFVFKIKDVNSKKEINCSIPLDDPVYHRLCHHCQFCILQPHCFEYFGEYIRFNGKSLSFCIYRPDLDVDVGTFLGGSGSLVGRNRDILKEKIEENIKYRLEEAFNKYRFSRLPYLSLRIIINDECNYNCSFPEGISWCHKEGKLEEQRHT